MTPHTTVVVLHSCCPYVLHIIIVNTSFKILRITYSDRHVLGLLLCAGAVVELCFVVLALHLAVLLLFVVFITSYHKDESFFCMRYSTTTINKMFRWELREAREVPTEPAQEKDRTRYSYVHNK